MKDICIRGDLSKIIKRFSYKGNSFHIEYFDGSSSDYICHNPEHVEKIREIMLNQALMRQVDLSTLDFNGADNILIGAQIFNALGFAAGAYFDSKFLLVLFGILTGANVLTMINNTKNRREFEKYALFFSLYEHLDVINDSTFLECVECDHIYQIPLNIETVDKYTLGQLQTIKKKLEQIKNRN